MLKILPVSESNDKSRESTRPGNSQQEMLLLFGWLGLFWETQQFAPHPKPLGPKDGFELEAVET